MSEGPDFALIGVYVYGIDVVTQCWLFAASIFPSTLTALEVLWLCNIAASSAEINSVNQMVMYFIALAAFFFLTLCAIVPGILRRGTCEYRIFT